MNGKTREEGGEDAPRKDAKAKAGGVSGLDLLLAAFAARGHLAEAWKELLAAAETFLATLEPVLANADREPAKSAHAAVVRLKAQVQRLRMVSFVGIAETILTLGHSLGATFRAKGSEAAGGSAREGANDGEKRGGAKGARRVRIASDE